MEDGKQKEKKKKKGKVPICQGGCTFPNLPCALGNSKVCFDGMKTIRAAPTSVFSEAEQPHRKSQNIFPSQRKMDPSSFH